MSLPRISYLETWEQNPASFRRHQDREQSPAREAHDDENRGSHDDLFDDSMTSSSSSVNHLPSVRHRLNFNPYGGLGWTQAARDAADDESNPLSRVSSKQGPGQTTDAARDAQSIGSDPDSGAPLETTGAFEVGGIKRLGGLFYA